MPNVRICLAISDDPSVCSIRLGHSVHFDEGVAGRALFAPQDRCVNSWIEFYEQRGVPAIPGPFARASAESRGFNRKSISFEARAPIIIGRKDFIRVFRLFLMMEFERWIDNSVGNDVRQRRTHAANEHLPAFEAFNHESSNHDLISRLRVSACTDIDQVCAAWCLIGIIYFDQCDSGIIIGVTYDGGVYPWL